MLDLAVTAARAAGDVLRARFSLPRTGVRTKSSATDMVSDADHAAEAVIRETIRRTRPDDAILGEEGGESAGATGLRWVVDPLDGTTNFLFGIPQWAVSIACEDGAGVAVGVVYDPMRDELFSASRGAGARLDGRPIRVSEADDLARALVVTGFSYRADERARAGAVLARIIPKVRDVRRLGAAALDLAWVACGRLDGYFETPIEWWDVAAGSLLVAESGGRTAPLASASGRAGLVAAGPGIFDGLCRLVSDMPV